MNEARHLRNRDVAVRPESIVSIVADDHNVHCLTEAHLDTWWASQTPEQKADIYEMDLEREDFAPPSPAVKITAGIESELGRSLSACQASFELLKANPDLAAQLVRAAEALLPKERSVDAYV